MSLMFVLTSGSFLSFTELAERHHRSITVLCTDNGLHPREGSGSKQITKLPNVAALHVLGIVSQSLTISRAPATWLS